MKLIKLSLYLICLNLILSSCSTTNGYYIQDANLPVSSNRKIISSLIGKPRIISENGRELTSQYHDQKFEFLEDDKKHLSRYYTKVIILGARRPFELSLEVIKEMFDAETQTYVEVGLVENLSQKRAIELKKILNKSLESKQLVDGEAPF